jgi:tetratricopeptide (TPR) repeat protein
MRSLACIVLALALITVATPAQANDKRAAAAAFQRGRSLYDAGQFADALAAFKEGRDAYPLPGFLVNIGQCQRKLDRLDEAQSSFQQFLASDSSDDRTRTEVKEALDEITAERARRAEVAEASARPSREEVEARRAPAVVEPSHPDLQARPVVVAPVVAAAVTPAAEAAPDATKKKGKKWVWAVVGVLAAGVAASAVTVGVLESQPPPLRPGSLGLLDGRR